MQLSFPRKGPALTAFLLWCVLIMHFILSVVMLWFYTPGSDILNSISRSFPSVRAYYFASIVIMAGTCIAAIWQLLSRMTSGRLNIFLFLLIILPWVYGVFEVLRTGSFRTQDFFGQLSLLFFMGASFAYIISSFWSARYWVVKLLIACILLFPLPYVYQDLVAFQWLRDFWSVIIWHVVLGLITAIAAIALLRVLRTGTADKIAFGKDDQLPG